MQDRLEPGTFVRAKVRTIAGWKDVGIVKYDDGVGGIIVDKVPSDPDDFSNTAEFRRHQLTVIPKRGSGR